MATSTQSKQQRLSIQMREILGDAYGFVRGAQYNKTAANITYEQLLDDAINRIEGTEGRSEVRPTKLERVKKIKEEISLAVDTVKARPPREWAIEGDDRIESTDQMNTEE